MAAAAAAAAALSGPSAATAPSPEPAAPGLDLAPEEELPELDPAEVRSRLEHSARQFRNRRKLLIRGLPPDVVNQDIHDLLADYDLKYCFVDKHKGTAWVTLRDGPQAAAALGALQGRRLRGRELRCQLQPPEALLCVANLPQLLSQQQFQQLLRPFGSLERCFLVYHPRSGHSKGYGFAEFLRRDCAARAQAELLGRQLGGRRLYVHWAEGSQLQLSPQLLHSRCLLVERLPQGFSEPQQLLRLFAQACEAAPSFCQVAVGPEGRPRGFAVLEFAAAAAAEAAQRGADGALLGGSRLRVSFCAPGPPGRSMLAALLAAQTPALSPGRGLLPEPNLLQLLGSSSALQLLLHPLLQGSLGGKQGLLGAAPSLPLLPPPALSTALLQLALQAQAQHQKPGILGESPHSPLPLQGPPQLLGDLSSAAPPLPQELPQGHLQCPLLPFLGPGEREGSVLGTPQAVPPQPVPPQALSSSLLGSGVGNLQKPKQAESGAPSPGVSLLGEPPKDLRIPLNPYLNLQSLLPPASLRGASSKSFRGKGGGGGPGGGSQPPLPEPLLPLPPPTPGLPGEGFAFDCPTLLPQLPSPPGLEGGVLGGPLPPFQAGSPTSYFASGLRAGLRQSHPSKAVGGPPAGSADPAPSLGPPSSAQLKTPGGGHKRASSHLLPSPEPSPEGCYVGQHSQGLGGHYADSYLKRKRIF